MTDEELSGIAGEKPEVEEKRKDLAEEKRNLLSGLKDLAPLKSLFKRK